MSVFGDRLKALRQSRGLSQEQLGVIAGIEEASASARMNRYEKGKRVPAYEIVRQIARALDVSTTYFYAESEEEATLLLAFHKMGSKKRKELLKSLSSF